jgi:hypothetical protein
MTEPLSLKKGDKVMLRVRKGNYEAQVFMASKNGVSLFLAFDGILLGYVEQIPVLWQDGEYRDLFTHTLIEIKKTKAVSP